MMCILQSPNNNLDRAVFLLSFYMKTQGQTFDRSLPAVPAILLYIKLRQQIKYTGPITDTNNMKTTSNPNTLLCNIKQAGLHKVNIYKSVPAPCRLIQ